MKEAIKNFYTKRKECLTRTAKTFFQAFAAMLITAICSGQSSSLETPEKILESSLTAAVAAGICAVMNRNK